MSRSQSPRLVDMLEFDSDDDFCDQVFEAYKELYVGAGDAGDKTLFLCRVLDNYEMYWTDGSPGAATVQAAVEMLGLKGVKDPGYNHSQAWFKVSRADKLKKLGDAGYDVRFVELVEDGKLAAIHV